MDRKIFHPLTELEEQFNRFLDYFQHAYRFPISFSTAPWKPNVTICETETQFIVTVEIPGTDPKNVKLIVENNLLIIEGEKKQTSSRSEKKCLHMEIAYGHFKRAIKLPSPVDSTNPKANYEFGMLTIFLQKSLHEKTNREISIKSID
ncbi:MAG: Hsp20/alpha crystallin family protein [bacterium]|nr:MAG: Hsp20/alpha crystallin family protein [bacterium]